LTSTHHLPTPHSFPTRRSSDLDLERLFNSFFLVFAQECGGDIAGARVTAQQLLPSLETLVKKDPDNPAFATALSLIHAVLGEKEDRKSTRLNSSHVSISYAVFC